MNRGASCANVKQEGHYMSKGRLTFTMIKPKAFEDNRTGLILNKICEAGFRIAAIKSCQLTQEEAAMFYEVHTEQPFFEALIAYMSSGPIIAAVLEKENAVQDYRSLIGATNPEEAAEGTIRQMYGTDIRRNAVHGSDSDENALIEAAFFFSERELLY